MTIESNPTQSRSEGSIFATTNSANDISILAAISELTKQLSSVPEDITEIKKSLCALTLSLQRLERSSQISELSSQAGSHIRVGAPVATDGLSFNEEKVPKSMTNTKSYRRKRNTKYYMPRRPNWSLKILDQKGLDTKGDINAIEINEPTKKCLQANNIGYPEKSTLKPLINGNDAILQIRNRSLENLTIYPIMDVLDLAVPELQILIAMNKVDTVCSRNLLDSLRRFLEVAGIDVALHIISSDKKYDLESLKNSRGTPTIFVSTPDMMLHLSTEGIIKPQIVNLLIVYEAENSLRVPGHVIAIQSILKSALVCQVILTAHDGTEELVKAVDTLEMPNDTVIFSMDRANIQLNSHFYYQDDQDDLQDTNKVIDYAVELSKQSLVVIICRDVTELNEMRNRLIGCTEILPIYQNSRSTQGTNGVFITIQLVSRTFQAGHRRSTKMILNFTGKVPFPDKYLEMMASYMEVGEKCRIVTRDEVRDAHRKDSLESLGVIFQDIDMLFA